MNPFFDSIWNTYIKYSIPIVSATIGALGGGIVSGFVVHWLTRSREQEAWLRSCVKEEWKELFMQLGKMEHSTISLANAYKSGDSSAIRKELDSMADNDNDLHIMSHSRLFIREDLQKSRLFRQWFETYSAHVKAASVLDEEQQFALGDEFDRIHYEMRAVMMSQLAPQRQWRWRRLQFWED